jgi:uncharacterized protein (TIGR00251 family)
MMKIKVQVKPNSKIEEVKKLNDDTYIVRVNTPPIDGKANKRVLELLGEHFQVPKTSIRLVSGDKSRIKVFELP